MTRYKVIDPKGVFNGEKILPKGEVFSLEQPTSRVRAWLRFKQVEETKSSPDSDKAAADKAAADSSKDKKSDESKK